MIFEIDKRDMIKDDATGTGHCMSGVNNGEDYPYVLGDVFLTNVAILFDIGGAEIALVSRGQY